MTRHEQKEVKDYAIAKLKGDCATIKKDGSVWVTVIKYRKVWPCGFAGYVENLLAELRTI